YQDPQPGEEIDFGADVMRIEFVETNRALVFRSAGGRWVWSFVLTERPGGGTRLVSRNRYLMEGLAGRLIMELMISGSLIMERKMLQGIKQRAEHLAVEAGAAAR